MEKAKIKLFGAEISVSVNDEQVVLHNSTPSEYSPTPTSERQRSTADHHDEKDVFTALGLLSATRSLSSSQVSRRSPAAKKRAFDEIDHGFNNIKGGNINNLLLPIKKRFPAKIFPSQVGGGMVDDEALLPTTGFGSTTDHGRSPSSDDDTSRKFPSKKMAFDEIHLPSSSSTCDHGILDDSKFYSPMPLRCFPPMNMIFSAESRFSRKKNKAAKSKENKKKKEKSLAISIPPVLPLENIPGLMEKIGSTKPVFLYKKKMEESDVRPHLNRLFIPGSKIELMEFLSEEERAAITSDTRKGLEFFGIDKNGESYNLRLVKWDSLRMTVINKEWMKMVSANNVQKGDWVELWGYRVNNNEFRLVINFRKSETHRGSSSSCTTNVGGLAPSPSS